MNDGRPVIVTGCGRSGTRWLGKVMRAVFGEAGAAWEPRDPYKFGDVVVDSRLRSDVEELDRRGHRIVHLVRDGRDVVRSLDQWYRENGWSRRQFADGEWVFRPTGGEVSFEECCLEWADAVDRMSDYPVVRLKDIRWPTNVQEDKTLPHWSQWDEALTKTFWDTCGEQMRRMGYNR